MESEEFKKMRDKALLQLMRGESLTGKDGVFAPLIKQFIESALEGEMASHLNEKQRNLGNKRNGKGEKVLKTSSGSVLISTPQDRLSSFEPMIVKKRERVLSDNLAPKIIGLYGLGMSLRDISRHIKEMYDVDISHDTLSEITDRVIPQVKEWQNRPLESVYPIVWMDALHYKVRDGGRVVTRAVYNVLSLNVNGHKDLIGMYVSESEGANFWLSVLTDLKSRGVKDILIACTDNLKGFAEAILSIFPKTEVQSCIIHQIRNSLKYIARKDKKLFMQDLRMVYQAANKDLAEQALLQLEEKWMGKYPVVINSWYNNWNKLSTFFQYDDSIRRVIYTTNAIEGFHRQVRKVTKTKGAFTNDMALLKLIYLTVENISKGWTQPLKNWGLTAQQLNIRFGERMKMII
jgi:putative transposase